MMEVFENLNSLMQFKHVIRVEAGCVSDTEPDGRQINAWAPECAWNYWGDGVHIEPGRGWTLLDGYSMQGGYTGPIMHPSEYIGGQLEQDILANDGYYVAIVCTAEKCDQCDNGLVDQHEDGVPPIACDECGGPGGDSEPAGMAVAYRPLY